MSTPTIARAADIAGVAHHLGLPPAAVLPYGLDKAKIDLGRVGPRPARGRLVLVSGMTPTAAGEGKTTTAIGLADGLTRRGQRAVVALREPSLGPCFGQKGGGTGFGRARLVPTADINLHFTGDFHAVTSAHNLLAALIDNHLHHGRKPALDPAHVTWRRVLDVNDRALRSIELGRGKVNGPVRDSGFDITAASEVMAILALASDRDDLRARLGRIVVGRAHDGEPVTAGQLGGLGAMMALLRDALHPNLVQTVEGTPALIHAGPFANIAHGASSVVGTRLGLALADWTVTECGFGFDLGGEKFFDIVGPASGLAPAVVVVVATTKALKLHGGHAADRLHELDPDAVAAGLPNLARHLENVALFGRPAVVALNQFPGDHAGEHAVVREFCVARGIPFAVQDAAAGGGEAALELADRVMEVALPAPTPAVPLYAPDEPLAGKIEAIARRVYRARRVIFTAAANLALANLERDGFGRLAVCMAKTQSSFTDDPHRLNAPTDFDLTVRDLELAAGAGFVVALTGTMMRMPGLPRAPRAFDIDLVGDDIVGVG